MRAAMVVVLLGGRGGGEDPMDLTGVYQVSSVARSAPCGDDMPAVSPPAYVKLSKDKIFGQDYFKYEECTDAAGTDCMDGGVFFGVSFFEPIDGGWKGEVTGSSSGGSSDPMCLLSYSLSTALLDGAALTVETTEYSDEVANTEQLCTTDEADRRGTSMTCDEHLLLMATKL